MKKNLFNVLLVLLFVIGSLTSCRQTKEFGEQEKLAITDTINQLMDKVSHYASIANADSAFQWLSDDTTAVFVSGGLAYNAREIASMFTNTYNTIKNQKFEPVSSRVIVLSPDAAVWFATMKEKYVNKDDEEIDQFLVESWLWRREASGWKVLHYNESILQLPDACKRATVEYALADLAMEIKGKALKPADMPPILTKFLKENPLVYGSALAFAPTEENGKNHAAAPYVYRHGSEFKQVELPESYDYTLSEWYSVPVDQQKPVWSNPYYDDGGGGVVMVTYSIPLYDDQNKLTGVLTGDFKLK